MTCQKIGQSKKWNKISLTYSKDSQILQSYMNKKQSNLNKVATWTNHYQKGHNKDKIVAFF